MGLILVLLSILATIVGFFTLSEATLGVGILAVACIFAILARLAQADAHHKELKKILSTRENKAINTGAVVPTQSEKPSKLGGLNDEIFSKSKDIE